MTTFTPYPNPVRLSAEFLEDRNCPSPLGGGESNPDLPPLERIDHEVRIVGASTAESADLIVINEYSPGTFRVTHHTARKWENLGGIWVPDGNVERIQDGFYRTWPGRLRLVVEAGPGNDVVINNTALPLEVHGGDGDDTIYGGAGDDLLYGDAGVDSISGFGGDDYMHGNGGRDFIYGNEGDDTIHGGDDDDVAQTTSTGTAGGT